MTRNWYDHKVLQNVKKERKKKERIKEKKRNIKEIKKDKKIFFNHQNCFYCDIEKKHDFFIDLS